MPPMISASTNEISTPMTPIESEVRVAYMVREKTSRPRLVGAPDMQPRLRVVEAEQMPVGGDEAQHLDRLAAGEQGDIDARFGSETDIARSVIGSRSVVMPWMKGRSEQPLSSQNIGICGGPSR
jgi:hypothetical protein